MFGIAMWPNVYKCNLLLIMFISAQCQYAQCPHVHAPIKWSCFYTCCKRYIVTHYYFCFNLCRNQLKLNCRLQNENYLKNKPPLILVPSSLPIVKFTRKRIIWITFSSYLGCFHSWCCYGNDFVGPEEGFVCGLL